MVECLPSLSMALGLISGSVKKKRKEEISERQQILSSGVLKQVSQARNWAAIPRAHLLPNCGQSSLVGSSLKFTRNKETIKKVEEYTHFTRKGRKQLKTREASPPQVNGKMERKGKTGVVAT